MIFKIFSERANLNTFLSASIAGCALLILHVGPTQAQSQNLSKLQGGHPVEDRSGPPIAFWADLSADEESAVTESPGKGHIEFMLDRPTLTLTWKLTFSDLTSASTGAHIHGPQTPGGEAGALIDLAPKGVRSPIEGSKVLNDGELEYLLTGRMYVNIHTTRYPAGEIRGQLQRRRPKNPNS